MVPWRDKLVSGGRDHYCTFAASGSWAFNVARMPDESRAAVRSHLCNARVVIAQRLPGSNEAQSRSATRFAPSHTVGVLAPSAVNLWEGASIDRAILLLPVYRIGAVAHTTGL
jgi:hypothetical protein